jgi:hypothetical protein
MGHRRFEIVEPKRGTMHSPVALTFDAEIKRISVEQDKPIGDVIKLLAERSGISWQQLYNYRSGKTDIPASLIPVLCKQFGSNSLAMAVVGMCEAGDWDPQDAFDLADFVAGTTSEMLGGVRTFIDAARDGQIDGHELLKVKNVTAAIVRNAHRILEVATQMRERRAA